LQVLFDTLRNHGHLFSLALWERVFESVLFRIFDYVRHAFDPSAETGQGASSDIPEFYEDSWIYGTCTLSLELVVDLFIKFYPTVNPLLRKVLMLLVSFIRRPHQSLAGIGIAAFVRLVSNAGSLFSDEKWLEVVLSLKEATTGTLPDFSFIAVEDNLSLSNEESVSRQNHEGSSVPEVDQQSSRIKQQLYSSLSDNRVRCAVQLLLVQVNICCYSFFLLQCMSSCAGTLFLKHCLIRVFNPKPNEIINL